MSVDFDWTESHGMQDARFGAVVYGPTDRTGVLAELLAELPATYGPLTFQRLESADLVKGTTDVWNCRLLYGPYRDKEELQAGDSEFKFSSVKRTITRTISLASRCYELDDSDPPETVETFPADLQIIGYNPNEHTADGVSDTDYLDAFSWRVAVPFSTATESWRRQVGGLRGSVCNHSFFGYDAGEVKFDDITGGVKADELYLFDLTFLRSPNIASATIGGITVPNILGWDHIDATELGIHPEVGGSGPPRLVPVVSRVKVHRNYILADWSILAALLGLS